MAAATTEDRHSLVSSLEFSSKSEKQQNTQGPNNNNMENAKQHVVPVLLGLIAVLMVAGIIVVGVKNTGPSPVNLEVKSGVDFSNRTGPLFNFELMINNLTNVFYEREEPNPPTPTSKPPTPTPTGNPPTSTTGPTPGKKCDVSTGQQISCIADTPPSEDVCNSRGCCWNETTSTCSYPSNFKGGYKVTDIQGKPWGFRVILELRGQSEWLQMGLEMAELHADFIYHQQDILRIKIYDSLFPRYEVSELPIPVTYNGAMHPDYEISLKKEPFGFKVIRKQDKTVVFDTNLGAFIFSDQFIQLSTSLPSEHLYGLGEHHDKLLKNQPKTYPFWNKGEPPVSDTEKLYGAHPFYMVREKSGLSHGVFLLNSNAMDVTLVPGETLTYRTIGGILDLSFFLGPSPDDVIREYTSLIGRPFLPPYWSLGFHICKYGYKDTDEVRQVWTRTRDAGLPYDVQWVDIDYLDTFKDFTLDPFKFRDTLPKLVEDIHQNQMRFVPIFEPGLSVNEAPGTYPPFDEALMQGILIKNASDQILVNKAWVEYMAFIDFSNPKAWDLWLKWFKEFHDILNFDGAWLDMNEPETFIDGSYEGCPKDSRLDHPPYRPGGEELSTHTLCPSAKHLDNHHYDIHNLFSLQQTKATYRALKEVLQERPFIISRSSFAGHGQYGGHWNGDIESTWEDMVQTVPSVINFNMFGIPMMGADICGFRGDTTPELCARWQQLGAFYTFSRNHNDLNSKDQDPASMGGDVLKAAKQALTERYRLLPYLYSLFFQAHKDGTPVVRPLFYDYPKDANTLAIEDQFLWGQSLMIVPALKQGQKEVTPYLPKGQWFDYYTGTAYQSTGQNLNFTAPIDKVVLLVRDGSLIPRQSPEVNTEKSRASPLDLLVVNPESKPSFDFVWDDGHSMDAVENEAYSIISMSAEKGKVLLQHKVNNFAPLPTLESMTVFHVTDHVTNATVNGLHVSGLDYDATNKVLHLSGMTQDLTGTNSVVIEWF